MFHELEIMDVIEEDIYRLADGRTDVDGDSVDYSDEFNLGEEEELMF